MADEEGILGLQAKLEGLDAEALQQLLQAVIANKTKDSSQNNLIAPTTSSNVEDKVDQSVNNEIMESKEQAENRDTIDSNMTALENPINGGIDDGEQDLMTKTDLDDLSQNILPGKQFSLNQQIDSGPIQISEETDEKAATISESPNSLVNSFQDLQIKQEMQPKPEQNLTPASDILNDSATLHLSTQIQDQASPIFTPLDKESSTFDHEYLETGDDQKLSNIVDEEHDVQFETVTNDQYKTPLTSNQPSTSFPLPIQNGHDDQQNIIIPTEEHTGTQPDKILQNDQFDTTLKQRLTGFDRQIQSGNDEKLVLIPAEQHTDTQPNKSSPNDQFNTPFSSNEPPTSVGQHMTSDEVLPSSNPFTNPVTRAPSSGSFYHKYEKNDSPLLTQDDSFQDFQSVVPPLLIPLSRIGQYLPEGTVTFNTEIYVPLALKPAIVLKDQVAVMVFEQDDGTCKNCEKRTQNEECLQLEQQEEQDEQEYDEHTTYLNQQSLQEGQSDHKQHNQTYFHQKEQNQQRPQIFQQQQHNQAEQYQRQQQEQQYQQQQQHNQAEQYQRQQREQQYQQQQQHNQAEEYQRQQQEQQYQQQQQQQYLEQQQPFQQPLEHSQPYDDERSQQLDTSLFDCTNPDPSTSQQVFRYSSLPHLPTNTENQAPLSVTNEQRQERQSTRLPGLKAPDWMSDENCKNCCNCGRPFSVTRRKHHCRGCGKIFCSDCCDQLAQLPYLGRKVARICISCTRAIKKAHSDLAKRKREGKPRSSSVAQPSSSSLLYIPSDRPNHTQIPPPSIPENNFNIPEGTSNAYQNLTTPDGNFNPFNDFTQSRPDDPVQASPSYNGNLSYDNRMPVGSTSDSSRLGFKKGGGLVKNSWKIPSRPAGRTITWTNYDSLASLDEQKKRLKNISKALKNQEGAVIQAATKLSVSAKKIQVVVKQGLHEAWFLCSHGFASCGQKEVAFVLEKRFNEDVFPYEMLKVFRTLYSLILNQGERFEHGNYLAFNNPVLGSEENVGFLFISANKAPKLIQSYAPFKTLLFGILLKQSELPCAKYIPTRLVNALGVQQQCFPSPALSSRDRPSVCNIEPNELLYSTFFALNQFLNYRIPQALIPGVHILKSGSKVVLELPFSYQTEIIGILDSLLVDESKQVTVPIAGDLVPESSGHFLYSPSNVASPRRGFVVLQNSNAQLEPGNQYLAFSAILLVLTFGDACNSQTRFGIEVIEDGITVTLSDSQAREIRQAIYQGTNCAMSVGSSADSNEQFTLRWTSDTCPSILEIPTPIRVVQAAKKHGRGNFPAVVSSPASVRPNPAQTNVVIDRVKTRDIEESIQRKITSDEPQLAVNKLENDVRQACAGCLLTFANRLQSNAEKRLNLALALGPGNYKKWSVGPNNQPINLARSLQLALKEIDVPDVNDDIVFVFNVILQKRN